MSLAFGRCKYLEGLTSLWLLRWNAARCFATYLDQNKTKLCEGKAVLELGAGGGLPSLVSALCGARKVGMRFLSSACRPATDILSSIDGLPRS